jgi:hypothetical protein
MLKNLNKEKALKNNNLNPDEYNAEKVYKIIKKMNVPYNSLNKDIILKIIINNENGTNNNIFETLNLQNKTNKRKKPNIYLERINSRKTKKSAKKSVNKIPKSCNTYLSKKRPPSITSKLVKNDNRYYNHGINIIINKNILNLVKNEEEYNTNHNNYNNDKSSVYSFSEKNSSSQNNSNSPPIVNTLNANSQSKILYLYLY